MTQFKPMLAGKAPEAHLLRYPLLASPKLDGVRAIVQGGVVLSRSLKPIPNEHVQRMFGRKGLEGLDGELIVGPPTADDAYRRTMSGTMSQEGKPDVRFYVFDDVSHPTWGFTARLALSRQKVERHIHLPVAAVSHVPMRTEVELNQHEADCLTLGYEGVMLRDPEGPYKHGRSTAKEGWLLKLKRFADSEAVVIGVTELMHNANEAVRNKLGQLERSSHQANKRGKGTLGALVVRDLKTGTEFELGTGFDQATREELWQGRDQLAGQLVKYKHFPGGAKDKPRFPVFLGLRDRRDV